MAVTIQTRRDTAVNWTTVNPVLALGEIGIETDTKKAKFGDGINAWAQLGYFIDPQSGGGVEEAPIDGNPYVRQNAGWVQDIPGGGGVPEAPQDGTLYGRQDAAWLAAAAAIHTHVKADITDFSDADYAAAAHTHSKSEIVDFDHTHLAADLPNDVVYAPADPGLKIEVVATLPGTPDNNTLYFVTG